MFSRACARLRIAGPGCSFVREGDIKEGLWFLQYFDGTFEDFSGPVRVTVEDCHMKATDWIVNPPVVSTDENTPCYRAIKFRSTLKGENCLWGPEYCLRIYDDVIALLYLGNKSSRGLVSTIRVGGVYDLFPKKRIDGNYVWYMPRVVDVKESGEVRE